MCASLFPLLAGAECCKAGHQGQAVAENEARVVIFAEISPAIGPQLYIGDARNTCLLQICRVKGLLCSECACGFPGDGRTVGLFLKNWRGNPPYCQVVVLQAFCVLLMCFRTDCLHASCERGHDAGYENSQWLDSHWGLQYRVFPSRDLLDFHVGPPGSSLSLWFATPCLTL